MILLMAMLKAIIKTGSYPLKEIIKIEKKMASFTGIMKMAKRIG